METIPSGLRGAGQWGRRIAAIAMLLPMYGLAQETVTVCVHQDSVVHGRTLISAEELAGRIFAEAGVRIDWCRNHSVQDPISVEFSERTPGTYHPGAMAFALPYEGVHIAVFYDRILRNYPADLVTPILGHVLAHEITHILEGIDRHSESGVMKAHWTSGDLITMASKPLSFSTEDIELIQSGLEARERTGKHRMNLSAYAMTAGPRDLVVSSLGTK